MKKTLLLAVASISTLALSAQNFVIFTEAPTADAEYYDPSWTTATAPSSFTGIQDGKVDVSSKVAHEGTQSLVFTYKSAEGGSWDACVAAEGWKTFDLAKYKELNFYVYSESALTAAQLPAVKMEAGYTRSNPVSLSSVLPEGIPAKTWTKVALATADLLADAPAAFASSSVKSVFLTQDNADGAEHTIYVDDMVWIYDETFVAPSSVAIFTDSSHEGYHDPTWVNVTAPSAVEQNTKAEKLDAVTDIVKEGENSLKLTWTSANGGNWVALVAATGWAKLDASEMENLSMWVYAPAAISKEEMPLVYLESHSGNPNQSGKVKMGDYIESIPANTWTEVIISLADIKAANPEYTAIDVVKGVFFAQDAADGKGHTLYLDEMYFTKADNGSVSRFAASETKAFFANDAIIGVEGQVKVYNLAGALVAEGIAENGKLATALAKGLYIVESKAGNSKIIVR